MRIKSFLLIGIAMLTLVGCAGGGEVSATATPAGQTTPTTATTP